MFALKKKTTLVVATVTFALAGTGGAIAYWTTNGSGSGDAVNGTSGGSLALHAVFAAGLVPGGSTPVTFTADNLNKSSLRFSALTGDPVITTGAPGCLAADFSLAGLTTTPTTVAPGASGVQIGSATLNFANTTADQDACKGATITVTLASA